MDEAFGGKGGEGGFEWIVWTVRDVRMETVPDDSLGGRFMAPLRRTGACLSSEAKGAC